MTNIFNPGFDVSVTAELDRRSKMPDSWKYKKYAYINLELTGESATNICVEDKTLKIGDTNLGNLYTTDGDNGPRRPNITLQSVNIRNEGGSDYTNAYLYEIEASFKVWSLTQMDQVEKGFFRLGAEMKVSFGWKGRTEAVNAESILASIYNFGFSMDNDGSYTCNVKAMSAAGLFGQETMGGERTTKSLDLNITITGENKPFVNAIEAFILLGRKAFGILDGEEDPADALKDNECKFKSADKKYTFAALELEKPSGWTDLSFYAGGSDQTILYARLGSIIRYLNTTSKDADGLFEINIDGTTDEYKLAPDLFKNFGSANPYSTFIPIGEAGKYGATEEGLNFTKNYNITLPAGTSEISQIFINTNVLAEAYDGLQGSASGKDGAKAPPKTMDFLSKLFSIIETDTGGVVRLQTRPRITNLDSTNTTPTATKQNKIDIINRAMIPTVGVPNLTPYTFSVLGENSITRNVSLQSDFDTDLLIKASSKSMKEGSSNMRVLSGLYSNCKQLKEANTPPDKNTRVIAKMITKSKQSMGDDGWSSEKASTLTSLIQKFVGQNSHTIATGAYAEVPMMLKLGVTIDGISGVKYMSPIKIDRMPKAYNIDAVDFPIISIEHSFDGQGDWSTTYETVMRIK
jgi:hypothetical protein